MEGSLPKTFLQTCKLTRSSSFPILKVHCFRGAKAEELGGAHLHRDMPANLHGNLRPIWT